MPRHGRDVLVPHFALLDQLEVKREHREIAAAGAPRRVIGGDSFLVRPLRSVPGRRRRRGNPALRNALGYFNNGFTHKFKSFSRTKG
jgi:hypothetical protein